MFACIRTFWVGKNGGPVNYYGYQAGLENMYSILKKEGKVYFSVPIGPQRIEFNAHRVFSVRFLLDHFSNKFNIGNFSFVDDKGGLHEDVALSKNECDKNFGFKYGCGIFELTKLD